MSLDSLYADGIEADIQRQVQNPQRAAPPSFSAWSMLGAGAKGVPAGGLEAGASLLDLLKAAPYETARHPRPAVLANQPDPRSDADLINAGALGARQAANSFYPTPETSSTADQIMFGLTRVGTKAIAAVGTMGPVAGGVALGTEETNTEYQKLIAKGVAPDTALKVAAVQGAITGTTVGLPMVGPTVGKTLGLMAASGPGAFVAQEAMSKAILAKAGYHDEASLHNPADPLGLAVSMILPGIAGGVHIAGLKAPSLADVAMGLESAGKRFGKDGKLLTSPKGAQGEMQVMPATVTDPGFGVKPAVDNSADEIARVGRDYIAAMQNRYGDPDKALAAYNAGPGAVDKAIAAHGADWLAHLPDETQKYVAKGMKRLGDQTVAHAAADPEAVDAARVSATNDALRRSLPDTPEAHAEVLRASDAIAAGEMPQVEPIHLGLDFTHETTGAAHGQVDSTLTAMRDGEPVGRIDYSTLDGKPKIHMIEVDPSVRRQGIGTELTQEMQRRFPDQEIDWGGMTPDGVALKASLPMSSRPVADVQTKLADLAAAVKERDARIAEVEAPGYKPKAEDGDQINALHDRIAELEKATQGVKPTQTLIDAPPRPAPQPRSQGTNALPRPESVALEAPKAEATAKPVQSPAAARVEKLAEENPDMKVMLPGRDRPMGLTEALQTAKAEAAEEAKQALLVKAALDCALSF